MNTFLAGIYLTPLTAVLLIPAAAAVLLALLPGYWIAARINVLAAFATLVAATSFLFDRPEGGAICWSTTSTSSSSC